ncbi:hypothetical protein ACFL6Y_06560 [Elusimicrobiota bacterium]
MERKTKVSIAREMRFIAVVAVFSIAMGVVTALEVEKSDSSFLMSVLIAAGIVFVPVYCFSWIARVSVGILFVVVDPLLIKLFKKEFKRKE